ncbi:hypothetical protein GJAV_G00193300 [Gymnothorax javanicus]|nr:hypothetical protein GJAV_G00193300 [Gymnothorax javanicus]
MFHLVSLLQTNEVEVVPDVWVNGGQCARPKLRGENLTKAVKTKQQPQKEWKKYRIRILYTAEKYDDAEKKLPEAKLFSDIQSDTEAVKMPRRILRNRRLPDYDDVTDTEDDGHTVSGLEPPPVIKPPQPAVVAQASAQHSSSYRAAKEPLTANSRENYQQSLFNHPASQPSTDHSSRSYQQCSFFQLTGQPTIHSSGNYQQTFHHPNNESDESSIPKGKVPVETIEARQCLEAELDTDPGLKSNLTRLLRNQEVAMDPPPTLQLHHLEQGKLLSDERVTELQENLRMLEMKIEEWQKEESLKNQLLSFEHEKLLANERDTKLQENLEVLDMKIEKMTKEWQEKEESLKNQLLGFQFEKRLSDETDTKIQENISVLDMKIAEMTMEWQRNEESHMNQLLSFEHEKRLSNEREIKLRENLSALEMKIAEMTKEWQKNEESHKNQLLSFEHEKLLANERDTKLQKNLTMLEMKIEKMTKEWQEKEESLKNQVGRAAPLDTI